MDERMLVDGSSVTFPGSETRLQGLLSAAAPAAGHHHGRRASSSGGKSAAATAAVAAVAQIEGIGVSPDVPVESSPHDAAVGRDVQLEAAVAPEKSSSGERRSLLARASPLATAASHASRAACRR